MLSVFGLTHAQYPDRELNPDLLLTMQMFALHILHVGYHDKVSVRPESQTPCALHNDNSIVEHG